MQSRVIARINNFMMTSCCPAARQLSARRESRERAQSCAEVMLSPLNRAHPVSGIPQPDTAARAQPCRAEAESVQARAMLCVLDELFHVTPSMQRHAR